MAPGPSAADGSEAVAGIADLISTGRAPDVALVDLVMPGLDGIGVAEALRRLPGSPRVVILSSFGEVVLWAFSPEEADDEGGLIAGDLVGRILGPRAAVDSDGTPLALPGWEGDDVIVAQDSDSLASAFPVPRTMSQPSGRTLQEVP